MFLDCFKTADPITTTTFYLYVHRQDLKSSGTFDNILAPQNQNKNPVDTKLTCLSYARQGGSEICLYNGTKHFGEDHSSGVGCWHTAKNKSCNFNVNVGISNREQEHENGEWFSGIVWRKSHILVDHLFRIDNMTQNQNVYN